MEFTGGIIKQLTSSGRSICINSKDSKLKQALQNSKPEEFKDFSHRSYYHWRSYKRPMPISAVLHLIQKYRIKSIDINSFSVSGGNCIEFNDGDIRFYYLIGLLLGDGCLIESKKKGGKTTFLSQITVRTKREANKLKELIYDLFKIKSSIYKGKGCFNVCTFSKPLLYILNRLYEIPIGEKYGSIKVPTKVAKSSKTKIKYFIRGLFDSDGNIYLHKGKKCIQLRQKSKSFIWEIKDIMFKNFNIQFRNPYYDKANNSWLLWSSKKELVDNFINNIKDFNPL